MKAEQKKWTASQGWWTINDEKLEKKAQLVLAFGERTVLENPKRFEEIQNFYKKAKIVIASTSGNILGVNVFDESIVLTAIYFEKTAVLTASMSINDANSSIEAGKKLALALPFANLVHVFVISDGQQVNGTELVRGLASQLPNNVCVTGGLAGDGKRFQKTLVGLDAPPASGNIVAIGFYGRNIKIGFGSMGGWDPFGPERKVTRSKGNTLYELDGKSALELYKKYLGPQAAGLPSTGLLFPLAMRTDSGSAFVVRTILNVNEEEGSLIFAGDIPEGAMAQLMKANFDRLIDGASLAASSAYETLGKRQPDLAILVSCIGRRLVLDQRIEEELESVRDVIGRKSTITGFYSYGEIAPTAARASCELHNQTMTITTFLETME